MRVQINMPDAPWPTHGGREVYSHHLAAALVDEGHDVHAVLCGPATGAADAWPLAKRVTIHRPNDLAMPLVARPHGWLDARWRRYWGWSPRMLASLHQLTERIGPAVVLGAGAGALPGLAALPRAAQRVWLALDEPALFQRSIARVSRSWPTKLRRWTLASRFIAYQRGYRRRIDAAVAVSARDADALRRHGGFERVLTLPNGVDADFFSPVDRPVTPDTAVFWGRLDFEPNVQALNWFVAQVWPGVLTRQPGARLRVIGRSADARLSERLGALPGVEWIGSVDDIRPHVCASAAVVLPMRSGAGIKNKLLEAAAMARPVIASPLAVDGLAHGDGAWRVADEPESWCEQLTRVWRDRADAEAMGRRARRWVRAHHSWRSNARGIAGFVDGTIGEVVAGSVVMPRRAAERCAA